MSAGLLIKTAGLHVGGAFDFNNYPLPTPTALFRLPSGHRLAYDEYGNSSGYPLFYFHDSGSSRLECCFFHRSAKKQGYRLIAIDRPGIGCSEYYSYQSAREFCRQVVHLADDLGLAEFGVMSLGAGGIYGMTLAHLVPARVKLQLSIAGVPGNVFNELNSGSYVASCIDELAPTLIKLMVRIKYCLFPDNPAATFERLQEYLSYTDRKMLANPGVQKILALDQQETIRSGCRGMAQDLGICFRKLDFSLREIEVPSVIWQGTADRLSQRSNCEYMVSHMPRASYYRVPNRGHFFFIQSMDDVFYRLRHSCEISHAIAA